MQLLQALLIVCVVQLALVECRFDRLFRRERESKFGRLEETTDAWEYRDAFAREKIFPLAAAAYSDTPEQCLKNVLDAKLKRFLKVTPMTSPLDEFAGFSAVSTNDKAIILSFRGSAYEQLLDEGCITIFEKQDQFVIGGSVGDYFYQGFNSLWFAGMKDDFLVLLSTYPDYDVWVTGHSLGGAMASLAASWIVYMGSVPASRVQLVTFGQPRTGDKDYAAAHDALLPNAFRVVHKHDMVPHLPPEGLEGYNHHRSEVWYNNDMEPGSSFVVCLEEEGSSCSNSALNKFSIADHVSYFGYNLVDYGNAGCK